MSKFPNKTAKELRQYFNKLDLNQLVDINRSYGPHFSQLEERLDKCHENLIQERERLIQFQEKREVHLLKLEEVEMNEEIFQRNLASVNASQSRTERYIGRQSLGYSPMELYSMESVFLNSELSKITQNIQYQEDTITILQQKKSAAVSELRILNSVIEERRRLALPVPAPHMFLS